MGCLKLLGIKVPPEVEIESVTEGGGIAETKLLREDNKVRFRKEFHGINRDKIPDAITIQGHSKDGKYYHLLMFPNGFRAVDALSSVIETTPIASEHYFKPLSEEEILKEFSPKFLEELDSEIIHYPT